MRIQVGVPSVLVCFALANAATSASAQADDDDLDVPAVPVPAPAPTPEAPTTPEPAPPPVAATVPPVPPPPALLSVLFDGVTLDGYVQSQYQRDDFSQDQLAQGGSQLNQDLLVVRRGRIALQRRWQYAALRFELDANTIRGAAVGLRRAEAVLVWPSADAAAPYAELAAGLTDIPFGHELAESARTRLFMERSTASLALFPGEPDVGAKLTGGWRQFRYAVALLAGEPINERAGVNRPDPNAAKDLVARVGVELASRCVTFAGGVSLVAGTGFHPGKSATKDAVEWHDANENGAVDLGEIVAVPGTAATPSVNFDRWALGADLALGVHSRLGWTRVAAEIVVASNLDRGLVVADPVAAGRDLRHLGATVRVVQDLGARAFAGARFDRYDPNLDLFDERAGTLVPTDATITTVSPIVGAYLPYRARLALQYDYIVDHLARNARGVPTDLANDRFTLRLQVEL